MKTAFNLSYLLLRITYVFILVLIFWTCKNANEVVIGSEEGTELLINSKLSSHEKDSLAFDRHLLVLDSLGLVETREACVKYIDSIRSASSFTKAQNSYLNIIKSKQLLDDDKDSLAAIILEKEESYLISIGDTLGLSFASLCEAQGKLKEKKVKYKRAEIFYIKAKEIRKTILGDGNKDYASCLCNLATLYKKMGQYENAISLAVECKDITEATVSKDHPMYAYSVNNLAGLYSKVGGYEKAEPLYIQSKALYKKQYGEDHSYYATSLNNLGLLYSKMGLYQKAEPYILKSKKIRKKVHGDEDRRYASSLNNVSSLYLRMGQYEKAEPLALQSVTLQKKIYGEEHPYYANSLNTLAVIYKEMGQYEKAESRYKQAIEIRKETIGESHPRYAISLGNLGLLYKTMKQFGKAEPHYIQAHEIISKELGKEHPDFAKSLNNLAGLYMAMGNYKKAQPLYSKSKLIRKAKFGVEHPDYVESLTNLARLHQHMDQYDQAEELILESNGLSQKLLTTAFNFLSEKEKMNYHQRRIKSTNLLKSIGLRVGSSQLSTEIYNTMLFEKSLHLNSSIQTRNFIQAQDDDTAKQHFDELIANKKKLYKEYKKPKAKQTGIDSLENAIEVLEKKLAKASAFFRREQGVNKLKVQNIVDKLLEGEVAIEFTHFKKTKDSLIYYAACLLDKSGKVNFIPLCLQEELKNKLQLNKSDNTSFINNLYGYSEKGNAGVSSANLYDVIWQPLESNLEGVNKIYYSPSGLLNRLNLNALAIDNEKVIADNYQLEALMSTRSIAIEDEYNESNNAYTIGGVDYGSKEPVNKIHVKATDVSEDQLAFRGMDASLRGGSWDKLKWTKTETENINELLEDHSFKVTYKTKKQATEADFKRLGTDAPSPRILHLATHGFFFPDAVDKSNKAGKSSFQMSKHPLLRSGLVLAGGNHVWQGKDIPPGNEDGILTAYEISNMNLSNTELVVLSACETGLGDIQGSEGVYGLQRSFKMAGVKYLIMSLWHVPDRTTSVFMTRFYENYLENKMSIRDAFNKTQLEMKERFKEPHSWAGFVLIE